MNDRFSVAGLTLRPAQQTDLEGIAAVINANALAVLGVPRALIDSHGRLRQARYVAPTEQLVATAASGEIVGYVYWVDQPPHLVHEVGGAVHPHYRGRGIGTALLRWAEARARSQLQSAPHDAQIVMQANLFDVDQRGRALFASEGYQPVRRWIHLELEFTAPPPLPVWPAGVTVRLLDPRHDWPRVGPALEEAFVDHWGTINYQMEEAETGNAENEVENETESGDDPYFNSNGLCFVALVGDEVAGSCLCNARAIEWPATGKVGSLSIRRPFRRRGIARALLLHAFGEFYRRGVRRVITDTDGASFTGANQLYIQAGMRVFRQEDTFEKIIRPGRELRSLRVDDLNRL